MTSPAILGLSGLNGALPIEFIGYATASAYSNFTMDISSIDIQAGDIGILAHSSEWDDTAFSISTNGSSGNFTLIRSYVLNTHQANILAIELAGDETQITSGNTGNLWGGTTCILAVFRNAAIITTSSYSEATQNYGYPDPPSRSGFSPTSISLITGHMDENRVFAAPADYTLIASKGVYITYRRTTTMMAYKIDPSETENPGVFTSTGDGSWIAFTIELQAAA